jgi:hypothetical protein
MQVANGVEKSPSHSRSRFDRGLLRQAGRNSQHRAPVDEDDKVTRRCKQNAHAVADSQGARVVISLLPATAVNEVRTITDQNRVGDLVGVNRVVTGRMTRRQLREAESYGCAAELVERVILVVDLLDLKGKEVAANHGIAPHGGRSVAQEH